MNGSDINRRAFLGAAGITILDSRLVRGTQANSAVAIGLLGCGGRGTADADSMVTNAGARVVAVADLFEDQLEKAKAHFKATQAFSGPRAFEQIAAAKEVDAVVIATPPYFHPLHLGAVVDAGKHVYCEKPVAVDVPGAQRVVEIGRKAADRLSLEVGFQIRSAPPFVELVRRIHAGDLGEIAFGNAHYYCEFIQTPHQNVPPAQYRLRNWLYDRALSGDIIVEQNIHVIDICNWVLQGHPVKAVGSGSRKGRPDKGNCLGSCAVTFWYPNDVRVSFASTQFGKGIFEADERFFGTLGSSSSPYSGSLGIAGEKAWTWAASNKAQPQGGFSASGTFSDNLAEADAEKHRGFIQSIVTGKHHNQAAMGVESSLSAMLGRTAIYSGQEATWERLMRSKEVLDPALKLE